MRDLSKFYGLCETSNEINKGLDKGLTNEFICHFAKIFKAKTMRVWQKMPFLAKVNDDLSVTLLSEGVKNLKNYIKMLKDSGVERILLFNWGYLYPNYYKPKDDMVVPSYIDEKDAYKDFLIILENLYIEIAKEFKEIEYFEISNEPDGPGGTFLHPNNYIPDDESTMYKEDDVIKIALDMNFYASRGLYSINSSLKVLLPSFCNLPSAPRVLEKYYTFIENGMVPTIGEKNTNIDSYFKILNWHPYNMRVPEIDDIWLSEQKNLIKISRDHGDINKPIWYTECGWCDWRREKETNELVPMWFTHLLDVVINELPEVESLFFFRLSTLATKKESISEDNFGLIYNIYDEEKPGYPKPVALALAKYVNGPDYDLKPLYRFKKENNN